MVKHEVKLYGQIFDANISAPVSDWLCPDVKFKLTLRPMNGFDLMEIEQRVEHIKRMQESPYHNPDLPPLKPQPDGIFDSCMVNFETIRKPHLMDHLKGRSDCELIGQYVQVLGNIKNRPDGSCYLSFHIVEPKPAPLTIFESEDSEGDDWDF